jgi:pimeloyl-ACP methyl ester carboxylesterase
MNEPVRRNVAGLYVEVRGDGPPLLLIPGGNGDAGPYERVATTLAQRYTVISYDRRGFSRSPLQERLADEDRLAADVDDAVRLLDAAAGAPAHVFGSSSGAIVALELVCRHPKRVRTLVAHEPPLVRLLQDGDAVLDLLDGVYATYLAAGLDAAMAEFGTAAGMPAPRSDAAAARLPEHLLEMQARIRLNHDFWLEHEMRQYPRVVPDIAALQRVARCLVLAVGRESRGRFPYRPNVVLAERLGLNVVEFPGGHIGYATHQLAFAEQLADVLELAGGTAAGR